MLGAEDNQGNGSDGNSAVERQIPRFGGVIVFRTVVAVLSIAPLFAVLVATSVIPGWSLGDSVVGMFFFLALGLAVVMGLPSVIIARGLSARHRRAVWGALVHDAVVVSAIFGLWLAFVLFPSAGNGPAPKLISQTGITIGIWLCFLLEGLYLARRIWASRLAALLFIIIATVVFSAGPIVIGISRSEEVSKTRPLVAYADAHWVDMPDHASTWEREFDAPPQPRASRTQPPGPTARVRKTTVTVETSRVNWIITGGKVGTNRWRFDGGPELTEDHIVLFGGLQYRVPDVRTPEEARKLLDTLGVRDKELSTAGTQSRYGETGFCFWSPKTGGTWVVFQKGAVYLYLRNSADVHSDQALSQ